MEETYRTLRGWIRGDEPDEDSYFAYSATLRITGENLDFELISNTLRLTPTHTHRRGESRPKGHPWPHDMWSYKVDLPEERPLSEHIDLLWSRLRGSKTFLLHLKEVAEVDIFLGYRSNVDTAGVEVPASSLAMFTELDLPFGLSIIIT